MGKTKINTYAALLLITLVGAGASMMIIQTSVNAQTTADNYYNSLNNEAFGTSTAEVFVHPKSHATSTAAAHKEMHL